MSDLAVISLDKEFTLFKAISADVYVVDSASAQETFATLLATYKIVLVSEPLAEILSTQIRHTQETMYPLVLVLPTSKGSDGVAIKNLVRASREALGIDIFKEF